MLVEINKRKLKVDLENEHSGKIILKKGGYKKCFLTQKIANECLDIKMKNKLLSRANRIRNCIKLIFATYKY